MVGRLGWLLIVLWAGILDMRSSASLRCSFYFIFCIFYEEFDVRGEFRNWLSRASLTEVLIWVSSISSSRNATKHMVLITGFCSLAIAEI